MSWVWMWPKKPVLDRMYYALWDGLSWVLTVTILVVLRFGISLGIPYVAYVFFYLAFCVLGQAAIGIWRGLYRGRCHRGSFDEAKLLSQVVALVGTVAGLVFLTMPQTPRSLIILTPGLAFLFMAAYRFFLRAYRENHQARIDQNRESALIYGAGSMGVQLLRIINEHPNPPYKIKGFIDDDPANSNLGIQNSRVLGSNRDLEKVLLDTGATSVILTVPNYPREARDLLEARCETSNARLLVLPPLDQILEGGASLDQLHETDINDLLGRKPVETDLESIAGYLKDQVVLITGAGGSIGSELAAQVYKFRPKELVLLDRDEGGLHGTQLNIYGRGLLDTPDIALCDIRDKKALRKIFAAHQPTVVFHAAALKHLPLLEQYPEEGWKTNVVGTLNVLDCAKEFNVTRFVNISTDKAAEPVNVLGKTKRYAEKLTAWFDKHESGKYISVRFGNVLGSRGSVLHTFKAQIQRGGPVTVTDRDVERYIMTIPEACQLVIQAAAIGTGGEVMVLDMGEPVKIFDIAARLIKLSGTKIDIIFTGLREGEKMSEVLTNYGDTIESTEHELINRVPVPEISPTKIHSMISAVVPSYSREQ